MQWIEALINVSAFAGFIGIANAWPEINQESRGQGQMHPRPSVGTG
jgi:hypothetical protein